METNVREVFLTVNTHSVTGSYFGKIKMNPEAVGLPTGGATRETIMENARALGAAYHRVDRSKVEVVLVDDHGVRLDMAGAPDEGAGRALTCVR